jgi:hypothetical protein
MAGRAGRGWLVAAVVVVVVLVGLDLGARALAQSELASRAKSASGAQSTSASISGFPFLWNLLVQGSISRVHLHLSEVPAGPLRLSAVDVQLTGTHIDRGALFSHRQVHVTSIDSGTASVTVSAADLSAAVGDPVSLPGQGRVLVDVAGHRVVGQVRVLDDRVLVLDVEGVAVLRSDLTVSHLVPACALAVSVGSGQLTVSCTVAPVPGSVVQAVAGV